MGVLFYKAELCTSEEMEDEWDSLKYELAGSHRDDCVEEVGEKRTLIFSQVGISLLSSLYS